MYKNFTLTESERESILNQHMGHGYKQPINEQISIPDAVQLGSKAYNYIKSKISPNPEPQKTSGIPKFTPGQEMKIVNNIYCNYLNSIDGAAVLENINPFSGSANVISDDGITLKLKVSFIGLEIKGKAQTFKDTCVNIKKEDISDWNKEYNMLNINISNEMFSWDLGHSKC